MRRREFLGWLGALASLPLLRRFKMAEPPPLAPPVLTGYSAAELPATDALFRTAGFTTTSTAALDAAADQWTYTVEDDGAIYFGADHA